MEKDLTAAVLILTPLFDLAIEKGVSKDALITSASIPGNIFDSPSNRLTMKQLDKLLSCAVDLSGDDNFGLHLGNYFEATHLGIVGYVIMNCNTIGEAFEKFKQYYKIVADGEHLNIETEGDFAKLTYSIIDKTFKNRRHISEITFASIMKTVKLLTGQPLILECANFKHVKPEDTTEHVKIFGAPINFSADEYSLVFKKEYLNLQLKHANSELLSDLEGTAKNVLTKICPDDDFRSKVLQICAKHFNNCIPKIDQIAELLAMSGRNLQIKLKQENTTFKKIVDEYYLEIAIEHLKNKELTISNISDIMGFSEPSAFNRTFKRLTGVTPNEYREKRI